MADATKDTKSEKQKPRPAKTKDRYTVEQSLAMSRGDFSKHKKAY
jgi:hypothetical protein